MKKLPQGVLAAISSLLAIFRVFVAGLFDLSQDLRKIRALYASYGVMCPATHPTDRVAA
ncbi:hypothetical protein ACP6PL_07705 [Dapis sp. BLCC M126]|uniref:hypothetical protein n=1 Tax=Dapis sp. BLCC M126 TaxID=3400189 RepID=UPI003CF12E42